MGYRKTSKVVHEGDGGRRHSSIRGTLVVVPDPRVFARGGSGLGRGPPKVRSQDPCRGRSKNLLTTVKKESPKL